VFSKAIGRIAVVGLATLAASAVIARPALAALKYGSYELSQLAETSKLFEVEALLVFGIAFFGLAFVVRRWQASSAE
jgi:hypothetical protein